MDGEGIRTYTKRGKLIKQKKVKKPKGVGPRTIIKKVEVIPKNEIVEPPKRRGRPPKISIVLPPDESPKPKTEKLTMLPKKLAGVEIIPAQELDLTRIEPGESWKPQGIEKLSSRTQRLVNELGPIATKSLQRFSEQSLQDKKKELKKLSKMSSSNVTPEQVKQVKTDAKADSLYVQNLGGVIEDKEGVANLVTAELGVEKGKPQNSKERKKSQRSKSLERKKEPRAERSSVESLDLAQQPKKRGRPKKEKPTLPSRTKQLLAPLKIPTQINDPNPPPNAPRSKSPRGKDIVRPTPPPLPSRTKQLLAPLKIPESLIDLNPPPNAPRSKKSSRGKDIKYPKPPTEPPPARSPRQPTPEKAKKAIEEAKAFKTQEDEYVRIVGLEPEPREQSKSVKRKSSSRRPTGAKPPTEPPPKQEREYNKREKYLTQLLEKQLKSYVKKKREANAKAEIQIEKAKTEAKVKEIEEKAKAKQAQLDKELQDKMKKQSTNTLARFKNIPKNKIEEAKLDILVEKALREALDELNQEFAQAQPKTEVKTETTKALKNPFAKSTPSQEKVNPFAKFKASQEKPLAKVVEAPKETKKLSPLAIARARAKEEEEKAEISLGLKKAGKYGDRQVERAKTKAKEEAEAKVEEDIQSKELENKRKQVKSIKELEQKLKESKAKRLGGLSKPEKAKLKAERTDLKTFIQSKRQELKEAKELENKREKVKEIKEAEQKLKESKAKRLGGLSQPEKVRVRKERTELKTFIDNRRAEIKSAKEAEELADKKAKAKELARAEIERKTAQKKADAEEAKRQRYLRKLADEQLELKSKEISEQTLEESLREFVLEEKSAIKLQSILRGIKPANLFKQFKSEKELLKILKEAKTKQEQEEAKTLYEQTKQKQQELEEVINQVVEGLAVKLQAYKRGQQPKKELKEAKQAITKIQTFARGMLAQKEKKEALKSIVLLQSIFRSKKPIETLKQLKSESELSKLQKEGEEQKAVANALAETSRKKKELEDQLKEDQSKQKKSEGPVPRTLPKAERDLKRLQQEENRLKEQQAKQQAKQEKREADEAKANAFKAQQEEAKQAKAKDKAKAKAEKEEAKAKAKADKAEAKAKAQADKTRQKEVEREKSLVDIYDKYGLDRGYFKDSKPEKEPKTPEEKKAEKKRLKEMRARGDLLPTKFGAEGKIWKFPELRNIMGKLKNEKREATPEELEKIEEWKKAFEVYDRNFVDVEAKKIAERRRAISLEEDRVIEEYKKLKAQIQKAEADKAAAESDSDDDRPLGAIIKKKDEPYYNEKIKELLEKNPSLKSKSRNWLIREIQRLDKEEMDQLDKEIESFGKIDLSEEEESTEEEEEEKPKPKPLKENLQKYKSLFVPKPANLLLESQEAQAERERKKKEEEEAYDYKLPKLASRLPKAVTEKVEEELTEEQKAKQARAEDLAELEKQEAKRIERDVGLSKKAAEKLAKSTGKGLPYRRCVGMGDLSDGDISSDDDGGSDQIKKKISHNYIMPSSPMLRRGFQHPAMCGPSDHLHPNAAANIHAMTGGLLKQDLQEGYEKAVPKSLRPAVEELAKDTGMYAMRSKPVQKAKRQAERVYKKAVPKSLRPAVEDLGKDMLAFGKRRAGYGKGMSRSRSSSPSSSPERGGMLGCGSIRDKLSKMYKKAVPKSLRPAVAELAGDTAAFAMRSKPVKKLRSQAKETYEKAVPKSLRPAVEELAKDSGAYAMRQSGFGLKKGSEEARAFMAALRARKGKKKGSKGGKIPAPPSRSPITDPSLL